MPISARALFHAQADQWLRATAADFGAKRCFRGFYGQGIKEPRFDQIYGDNFGDFGNPSLKPESSKTWTAGIEQKLFNDRDPPVRKLLCQPLLQHRELRVLRTYHRHHKHLRPHAFLALRRALDFISTRTVPVLAASTSPAKPDSLAGLTWRGTTLTTTAASSKLPTRLIPLNFPETTWLRRPVNSGSLTLNAAYRRFGMTVSGYFTGVRTDSDFLGLGLVTQSRLCAL